ncbi:MAG: ORF6N domain-containing protein [Campylobacterota bacterium]|nr:ORF6N domain-containing protein [Campylobacterota bacterium]
MQVIKFETLENRLIEYKNELVLIDSDVAELYGVETKDVNKAVKNNPDKFPNSYVLELSKDEKEKVVENFHHLSKLKYSPHNPKVFTEKGLYMIATILKSKVATEATLQTIETFSKIKELSRNINNIMKTTDEDIQKELAQRSNKILEEVIDIDEDIDFVKEPSDSKSNYWLQAIVVKDLDNRDKFLEFTNKNGVMTRPIWKLMNELGMFKDAQCSSLDNAKYLEERVINISSSVIV